MVVTPPVLTTERLELRPPEAGDFPAVLAIVMDPRNEHFFGHAQSPADHFLRFCRSAGSWLLYGYGAFVIRASGEEGVIGNCGIFHSWRDLGADFDDQPEAGWMLHPDLHGKGLGAEAMTAVIEWFDGAHGPRRIVCMISPDNDPSIRLAGKLGFLPSREAELPDGEAVSLFERVPRGG